jgi:hypothetical protein
VIAGAQPPAQPTSNLAEQLASDLVITSMPNPGGQYLLPSNIIPPMQHWWTEVSEVQQCFVDGNHLHHVHVGAKWHA